jgi:hypothetical protein
MQFFSNATAQKSWLIALRDGSDELNLLQNLIDLNQGCGSGFNGVSGSGGKKKKKMKKKSKPYVILKFLRFFNFNFAAHTNTVYLPIFFQCCRAASYRCGSDSG